MARDGLEELNIFASSKTVILILSLSLSFYSQILEVESREFEWSDISVPIGGSKSSYNGQSPNNLRILISPQRRMNKNSEYDSSNYSQPTTGEAQFTGLGTGNSYSSPGQSAAYTALSASLASLKSRLNARGVSLSNRIPTDAGTGYPSGSSGSYISSEAQRPQTQPNYLSVANIQDQPISYSTGSHESHGNENKTIVLAIPAKINFLTDGSSKRHQQQPQITGVQPPPNSERSEYIKHYGVANGPDGSDQVRENNPDQEHQLVFVNSPTGSNEQTHLVTTNSFNNAPPPYSTVYYHPTGSLPVKYIQPSSQQAEVYHATSGEEVAAEEHYYENCIDTCNSADPRWRKYTVSKYKYCCSHSSQYDPQFETPSMDKVGESVRQAEDVYYNYLHRKARGRRSRKNPRSLRPHNRYHQSRTPEEEPNQEAVAAPVRPERHNEYPYMKYYKNRYAHDSHDTQDSSSARKYMQKEKRGYGRTREPEVTAGQYEQPADEEEPARVPSSGYGNSEYSIDNPAYSGDIRSSSASDEDDSRVGQEEGRGSPKIGSMNDGSTEYGVITEDAEEGEPDQGYRSSPKRRKKYHGKGRSRKVGKEAQAKRVRKSKTNKPEYSLSRANNATDYEQTQVEDQYKPDTTTTFDEEPYSKEMEGSSIGGAGGDESDKDKYKSTLNETAIVHLSKTTMHLKEILSMLEKKTQLKSNETNNLSTTAAPITTTNSYSSLLFNSQLGNPSLSSLDFLSTDQGLKNAYKELGLTPSLALPATYSKLSSPDSFSPLTGYGTSGLSLKNAYKDASFGPSLAALSPYGAKLNPDPFGALSGFSSSQLGLPSTKYLAYAASNPGAIRRRRVPRNPNRYNQMMLPKSHLHGGSTMVRSPSVTRSPYATSASLYQGLQYPSWYTRSSALAATNSYPFRNLYRTTWFQ